MDQIAVPQRYLNASWRLDTCKQDARREGDAELAAWSEKILAAAREAVEEGKKLPMDRLEREGG